MKKLILAGILKLVLISCSGRDCSELPDSFQSYPQAVESVRKSKFSFEEKKQFRNSSWIRTASYHSCDTETGFLLIQLKNKTYIYQGVPYNLWENFKESPSPGSFYNKKIKGRFPVEIRQ